MVTAADVKAYADEHEIGIVEAAVRIRAIGIEDQRRHHIADIKNRRRVDMLVGVDNAEYHDAILFLLENMK